MKKNTYFFKQLACLFTFLFLGSASVINTCSLHAAIIEDFPETAFRIVDHTTPQYTKDGNTQYNPKGIIGYYYKPRNIENAYQLTDTIPHMTVAIWNKNKIDLNQSWEFDLRLFFDTGNASHNQGHPFGSPGRIIADGIAFVLQNDARQDAIGDGAPSLGYAGIRPSFAIEFDTEYNNWWWEGYGTNAYNPNKQTNEHINYLKNGTVSNEGNITPPLYYKPMQNNWATVGVGDWFNVKIVWRKSYKNSKAHYDLLTYIEEKGCGSGNPQYGQLLLRDSIRFNNLGEVMTGLEVDENCQALVTWGITSATCSWSNHQMVQFVKLETTNVPPPPSPTVLIIGNCWVRDFIEPPPIPPITPSYSAPNNSINPYQPYQDILLQGAVITGCYEANTTAQTNDTIEYAISCADVSAGLKCNYWLSLRGISEDAEIEYYLNDTLVTDSSFYATSDIWGKLLYLSLKYPHENANSVTRAKIAINGAEYNFKIFVEDSTTLWAEQLAQTTDIQIDAALRTGTLELNSSNFVQSIQLPTLDNCQNAVLTHSGNNDSSFVVSPSIDSNNVLTFELKPTTCSAEILIKSQCNCYEFFTLTVKNTDCYPLCGLVDILESQREIAPAISSDGRHRLAGMMITYYISTWMIYGMDVVVDTVVATELATDAPGVRFGTNHPSNNTLEVTFSGCHGEYIYKKYEICATVTLEGTDLTVTCCDTFEYHDTCHDITSVMSLHAGASGEIYFSTKDTRDYLGWDNPPPPTTYAPLYVEIYDFTGMLVQNMIYPSISEGMEGTVYYDATLFYPIGYAVFRWNGNIEIIELFNY